jgi:hypothetical protein
VIVDGHYRYVICRKYKIPFSVQTLNFKNLDEAKLWAWQHQENRRNLTTFQRAEIALKFKPLIAAQVKERQGYHSVNKNATHKTSMTQPIDTRRELEKLADISHSTISKVEYIVKHGDNVTQERLRNGNKGTSIHREYCRLRSEIEPIKTQPESPKKTLPIGDVTPKDWVLRLFEDHPAEFVYEFLESFFTEYQIRFGNETIKHLLLKLCNKYID